MSKPASIWQIRLVTSTTHAPKYAGVLEDFCPTVSWMDTDEDGVVEVDGICESKPDTAAILAALKAAHSPVPKVTIAPLVQQDWLQLSYQSFPPKPLGRFWIHGSHATEKPPAGGWPLQIDAATAFGSGEHPTTAGCLGFIERITKRNSFRHVLDMGTGSGILAIAALRAGVPQVTAIDIDPESIRMTAIHGSANHVRSRLHLQAGPGYATPLVQKKAPYDLILCNILARPLRVMAKAAARVIAKGGTIILAGLLITQAPSVISAYRSQGFILKTKQARGEWMILELERP
jgi:ribosomal protein L11 methyltransferase